MIKLKASADPDSCLSKGGGSALSTIKPTQTGTIQQHATHLPLVKNPLIELLIHPGLQEVYQQLLRVTLYLPNHKTCCVLFLLCVFYLCVKFE
jgi:hypothetical protein